MSELCICSVNAILVVLLRNLMLMNSRDIVVHVYWHIQSTHSTLEIRSPFPHTSEIDKDVL
jgi:hypothetical protein